MFRKTFQCGFLSILYSVGSKPLLIWECHVKNGHIKRLTDPVIRSAAIEIMGRNVSTAFITCPAEPNKTLGIKLPFFVMIVKNMNKYFTFEISILDDKGARRRFRVSNFVSRTRIEPFICTLPMSLDPGWNQITFNLMDFVNRAYGSNYIETVRVQMHANVRIRRIFFSDRLYQDQELPREYRMMPENEPRRKGAAATAEAERQAVAAAEAAAAAAASPMDGVDGFEMGDGGEVGGDGGHYEGGEGEEPPVDDGAVAAEGGE